MAKRKLAKRGWISFTGLRFALKFATRDEIVESVRAFFDDRGVRNFGDLRIEFRRTKLPTALVDNQVMMILGSYGDNIIRVYVRKHFSRAEFLNTLGHELDHKDWELSGLEFDRETRYWDRPHEVRDRQTGSEWETGS